MDLSAEWLEPDGLGGFASGTVGGVRTRRYHGVLVAAMVPPTHRFMLVNGFDAWVEIPTPTRERGAGQAATDIVPLSSQRYVGPGGGVVAPDGMSRLVEFQAEPWPRWTYRLPDGTRLTQELVLRRGAPVAVLAWGASEPNGGGGGPLRLAVRPFLSGRDLHATHRENPGFRHEAAQAGGRVAWRPYDGVPAVVALSDGAYTPEPAWYRNFLYAGEAARGLDAVEDLASPGVFRWTLDRAAPVGAVLVLAADAPGAEDVIGALDAADVARKVRTAERLRRSRLGRGMERVADAYVVRRAVPPVAAGGQAGAAGARGAADVGKDSGRTIVAGYPWFTDWGRDTFISLRGLCLAAKRLDDARKVLLAWSAHVSEGMLPNRFPEFGAEPEYNAVDASLWYVVAVHEFLRAAHGGKSHRLKAGERDLLWSAAEAVLEGYTRGTRYGIRADDDGLLAAGAPGVALTWMDARVNGRPVTPRAGKPVEVQALWLNALHVASERSPDAHARARWGARLEKGHEAFCARFTGGAEGGLFDVVDVDHAPGTRDASLRPNQIFAVGGLPMQLLDGAHAAAVVAAVERHLVTPLGLRTLAPGSAGYVGRYEGGAAARDAAYHQGAAWPWLLGPFVEAWARVHGNTATAWREARARFLAPLLAHASEAGHLPELADGDAPHTARGCPFQAWSVGEVLRVSVHHA